MVICVLRVSFISVSPFPRVSSHVNLRDINDSGSLAAISLADNELEDEGAALLLTAIAR